jgi:hypothetical protein
LKQRIVGQLDDDGVGNALFTVLPHRDAHFGQFREADAEIDVGARIVSTPALLFAAVAREHHAAEVEAAIEGRGGGKLRGRAAVEARPDALGLNHAGGSAQDANDRGKCPGQPAAASRHEALSLLRS